MAQFPTNSTVRYVKNGRGGKWWPRASKRAEIHAGWKQIPTKLLLKPNYTSIESILRRTIADQGKATRDFVALKHLLDKPERHLWITFEDGQMWWCTVRAGAFPNPGGESDAQGHFCLKCDLPWSSRSRIGRALFLTELPGPVTRTKGFRGTVCIPQAEDEIVRIIRGVHNPKAIAANNSRNHYEAAISDMIADLHWQDFEQLVDLLLARTGWARLSDLGKTQKGIDIEVENPTSGETAFVQIKGEATQSILDEYVQDFQRQRDRYSLMIFAVNKPKGSLKLPRDLPVQVWTGNRLAELVVQLGLGKWLENKFA